MNRLKGDDRSRALGGCATGLLAVALVAAGCSAPETGTVKMKEAGESRKDKMLNRKLIGPDGKPRAKAVSP